MFGVEPSTRRISTRPHIRKPGKIAQITPCTGPLLTTGCCSATVLPHSVIDKSTLRTVGCSFATVLQKLLANSIAPKFARAAVVFFSAKKRDLFSALSMRRLRRRSCPSRSLLYVFSEAHLQSTTYANRLLRAPGCTSAGMDSLRAYGKC